MSKKECIAMLLAGGQGSRLGALTSKIAKPAVSFGGKFRIIDFSLSNCANSGIDTVGVLTQYRPYLLNSYVGSGEAWDLDERGAGVSILPPYATQEGGSWYAGTADAVAQNIGYIKEHDPEYVLILSGDHLYRMDYRKMLKSHIEHNADLTISVMPVPWEEASRFGIMTADAEGTITKFEEKPKEPKSNLASMGIYVFSWDKLRKFLIEDEANPASDNDFGKNIIPNMLASKEKMVAYPFEGYWKDVGTIDSLWEANMDLLNPKMPLDVWSDEWKIYSRNSGMPGQWVGEAAEIDNSMITEGCKVEGKLVQSVLFAGVKVGEGAVVEDSIIMPGAVVEPGAKVRYSIIAENVTVKSGAVVGERPEDMDNLDNWGVAVVGEGVTIGVNAKVGPKAMVVKDVKDGEEQW